MARLPKTPADAVALLGLAKGQTVLAVAPANGYVEAMSEAVGKDATVYVTDPPPELEAPANVTVVEEQPSEVQADAVFVWVGVVPVHTVRELQPLVRDGGVLWTVLPRVSRDEIPPVHEADLKRSMLVAGWRETRTVALATDAYAIRFGRRR